MNPFIYVQNQNLTPEFCNRCIDKFERDNRKFNGITSSGYKSDVKKSTDLCISKFSDWKNEDEIFCKALYDAYYDYIKHLENFLPKLNNIQRQIISANEIGDVGYQIQRTKPSEFYTWHNDAKTSNNKVRIITFIWYLNTIHEDGYTEFWDGTKIQPKQGKLLMFPATWDFIHRGYPPKSETKYICTGWLHYENQE